jgi:hypothetical protein
LIFSSVYDIIGKAKLRENQKTTNGAVYENKNHKQKLRRYSGYEKEKERTPEKAEHPFQNSFKDSFRARFEIGKLQVRQGGNGKARQKRARAFPYESLKLR